MISLQVFPLNQVNINRHQTVQLSYSLPPKVSWSVEKISHCISVQIQYVPGTLGVCVYAVLLRLFIVCMSSILQ